MAWNKMIVMAAAAAVATTPVMLGAPAVATEGSPATLQAKNDLAPLLKTRQLIAGDTWRQTVRVKDYRQIKLQVKSGSGPFRTVKSYKVPKNGKVKLSHTFSTPGQYSLRSIAVPDGAGRDVKSRPVLITVVAKRYQGTFGGDHTSGTSWSGTVSYFYQERDPVTNRPWEAGAVHYTAIEGSVNWNFDAAVLNGPMRRNCSAAPSTGQMGMDSLDANMTVEQAVDKTYKGRRYDLNIYVSSGRAPRIQYTCEYLEYDWDGNPNLGAGDPGLLLAVRPQRRRSAGQFPQRERHGRRWPVHQESVGTTGRRHQPSGRGHIEPLVLEPLDRVSPTHSTGSTSATTIE